MTLTEAIAHYNETSVCGRSSAFVLEHRQLAVWLEELLIRRNSAEPIMLLPQGDLEIRK
jgi:hypothetical protein